MPVRLDKQRARNPADKQARRTAIISAARQLLGQGCYGEVTMVQVARAAGVAKGTLYLYYRTKEELMLAVYEQELTEWLAALGAELARRRCQTAEAFSAAVSELIADRPVFAQLTAVLHTLLEHNIELDTAVQFKQRLLGYAQRGGAIVEACLPFLRPGEGSLLFRRAHAVMVGVHSVAVPSPVVAEALREPGLEFFNVEFASELADVLVALLRGMEVMRERSPKDRTE